MTDEGHLRRTRNVIAVEEPSAKVRRHTDEAKIVGGHAATGDELRNLSTGQRILTAGDDTSDARECVASRAERRQLRAGNDLRDVAAPHRKDLDDTVRIGEWQRLQHDG